MKTIFNFTLGFLLISCGDIKREEIAPIAINFPYEFIDSKSDNEGNFIELYAYSDTLSLDTLILFCSEKKRTFSTGAQYYMALFDNKKNATLPISPIAAEYVLEEEDNAKKHMKAFYVYVKHNGYSELSVYEKNRFESRPVKTKVK